MRSDGEEHSDTENAPSAKKPAWVDPDDETIEFVQSKCLSMSLQLLFLYYSIVVLSCIHSLLMQQS